MTVMGANQSNVTAPPIVLQNSTNFIMAEPAARIAILVMFIVTMVVGVVGNLVVLVTIFRNKAVRNATCVYIVNLAICDLIAVTVDTPLHLWEVTHGEAHPEIVTNPYCRAKEYFMGLFGRVAILIITAISIDRFIIICFPLKAKYTCSINRALRIILCIWIFASVYLLPVPLGFSRATEVVVTSSKQVRMCTSLVGYQTTKSTIYYLSGFVFFYIVPMIVLLYTYVKIFMKLNETVLKASENESESSQKLIKKRKKTARMMLCIGVIHAIAWGPTFLGFLYMTLGGKLTQNMMFFALIKDIIALWSSCLNPIIYSLHSAAFRRAIMGSARRPVSSIYQSRSTRTSRISESVRMNKLPRGSKDGAESHLENDQNDHVSDLFDSDERIVLPDIVEPNKVAANKVEDTSSETHRKQSNNKFDRSRPEEDNNSVVLQSGSRK